MYGNSAPNVYVYLKFKRFSLQRVFARMPFSCKGVLVILLAFSVCFNVVLNLLHEIDDVKVICKRNSQELCSKKRCSRKNAHENKESQNGRVIYCTKSGFTVTSKDSLLAGADSNKKVFLTIGLPTIERKGRNYLETTLNSLLYNTSKTTDFTMKIVILLADTKRSVRTRRLKQLTEKYGRYLEQGSIQVIVIPPKAYPPLRGLPTTLDDSEERVYWRSKQAIDFAFLMQYCQHFSPYYLQLEDDVIATRDYDIHIKEFVEEMKEVYWFNLDFSNLGFIGKLYRSETLQNQARLFRMFYTEMPVDLLMSAYRTMLGNDVAKTTYRRNIFEHIGYQTSALD